MHNEVLSLDELPILRYVFETLECIEINLLEEKVAMDFFKHEEKPPKKVKVAKTSLLLHTTDTTTTCFKCSKARHLKKDFQEGKTTTPQSGSYCFGCGIKEHNEAKCWKPHPELKFIGNKGAKAGGSKNEK